MSSAERISSPQAVKELLVEVLRVWVTRDRMNLTDAQISERAANGALALTTVFDVRHRDERPGWRSIATSEAPDPRISPLNEEYGKRQVSVVLAVDTAGRLFEIIGREDPVLLAPPPEVP